MSDVTRQGAPIPLYAGSLAAMPTLRLGAFAPGEAHTYASPGGEAHTYAFTVTLPAAAPGGTDINAYQSSALQGLCVDEHRRGPSGRGSGPPEDDAEPRSPAVVSAVGDAIDSERVRSGSRSLRGAEPR